MTIGRRTQPLRASSGGSESLPTRRHMDEYLELRLGLLETNVRDLVVTVRGIDDTPGIMQVLANLF